jgi:nitronate monooxygenase
MAMKQWSDRRILDLFGITLPIIQAPMAGAMNSEMVVAVSEAGGLGSLPCAMLSLDETLSECESIRRRTSRPVNLNFFCHQPPQMDAERERRWRDRLASYYRELGLDPTAPLPAFNRRPFDAAICDVVEQFRPEVVSFHFGLPEVALLARVKAAGAKVLSSATTVDEARYLEDAGCDAVIAQGFEAGGHRGLFLTTDIASQVGTMALVPQTVDAVRIPVIASGGIGDARGICAAFALGASAVQIGTAYLLCPESTISVVHRDALRHAKDSGTMLTNIFSGRPARAIANRLMREIGPISDLAPPFPLAAAAVLPLRKGSESAGSGDFAQMWAGQAARLSREIPAGDLTRDLAAQALARL